MPRSGELLDRLLEALSDELAPAVALRRRLHAAPELAHAEHVTSAAVGEALDRPTERAAGTGVGAVVGAGPAAIGVRAELDGLPIEERTGAPYASTNGAMHACGHDVHTAALVALVRAAGRIEDDLPAPLVALFQPSEEAYPSGAELLAREPVVDGVSTVLAAHVHPELDWGAVALDPDDRQRLRDLVVEVVEDVSRAHGCRGSVSIVAGELALVNDSATVAATLPLLASAGFAAAPPWRSCGSDLAFFGQRARLAMAFVGLRGAPDFQVRPLHNAEFLPPDEAVGAVARTLAALYVGAATS